MANKMKFYIVNHNRILECEGNYQTGDYGRVQINGVPPTSGRIFFVNVHFSSPRKCFENLEDAKKELIRRLLINYSKLHPNLERLKELFPLIREEFDRMVNLS